MEVVLVCVCDSRGGGEGGEEMVRRLSWDGGGCCGRGSEGNDVARGCGVVRGVGGSYRSGYGMSFWGSPEYFSDGGGGGGRRRLPELRERERTKFEETFGEAWERFKEMLRACPHHRFTELAQIDTFYNGLNDNDQDSLNGAAGENVLIDIFAKKVVTPAPVKAVEESCVTYDGPHAHYNCDATNSNQPSVCVATGTYCGSHLLNGSLTLIRIQEV
nr:reverse transcriptase domain-containing protein [Tanacetum cinerariifolium]